MCLRALPYPRHRLHFLWLQFCIEKEKTDKIWRWQWSCDCRGQEGFIWEVSLKNDNLLISEAFSKIHCKTNQAKWPPYWETSCPRRFPGSALKGDHRWSRGRLRKKRYSTWLSRWNIITGFYDETPKPWDEVSLKRNFKTFTQLMYFFSKMHFLQLLETSTQLRN